MNTQTSKNKRQSHSFHLEYYITGLGSNRGKPSPLIIIDRTRLTYLLCRAERTRHGKFKRTLYDTLIVTDINNQAIDSILHIIKGVEGAKFEHWNPDVMSGGVYELSIHSDCMVTTFYMHNAFDIRALDVLEIVNHYLPSDMRMPLDKSTLLYDRDE